MRGKSVGLICVLSIALLTPAMKGRDFVHIFTSKGIYETCEDLWFKCLVLDGHSFTLSDRSHTAFVEIVNPTDSVVWKEKYPVINGECDGHVYVGDDWPTGEYRMYVSTATTTGVEDSMLTPEKLLIVRELPEARNFVSAKDIESGPVVDSIPYGHLRPLNVAVETDSTDYAPRSKVRMKIRVTDANGMPQSAKIALCVYDRLYSYPKGELDLMSHCIAVRDCEQQAELPAGNTLLPDGPARGYLKSQKRKSKGPLENQFISVFDYSDNMGNLNFLTTDENGLFEIPADIAASMGRDILLKPVSAMDMKPGIELEDPFALLAGVRARAKDVYYPGLRTASTDEALDDDSLDYTGRRTIRLKNLDVTGRAGRYPKRNKLMGYLDSISTPYGGAWVCGCPHGPEGMTYLNDYLDGYTHHPQGVSYSPKKRSRPVKGQTYAVIKYTGGSPDDYLVDLKYVVYEGPKYSEEELLRMNGMWKAQGYYHGHGYENPDEEDMAMGLEDNRNTLLWLPDVATDSNGELVVEFPASDITSLFNIAGIAFTTGGPAIGQIRSRIYVSDKR